MATKKQLPVTAKRLKLRTGFDLQREGTSIDPQIASQPISVGVTGVAQFITTVRKQTLSREYKY